MPAVRRCEARSRGRGLAPLGPRTELRGVAPALARLVRAARVLPYGRCAACGQSYCPVYFGAEQLAALYSDMPDNTKGVDHAALRRTQGRYAATLRRRAPAAGDYLEVG